MIDGLGISIHDPDVVVTDLVLAMLGAYLGWRLWTIPGRGKVQRDGAIIMGALASAALWGAIFHAVFPAGTATFPGRLVWAPVGLSIVVAGAAMLELGIRVLPVEVSPRSRRWLLMTYAAVFAVVVVLLDHSFTSIVYFYVPALFLLLVAAARQAVRSRAVAWRLMVTGLILSAVAALLQQARVAIHPIYFDHNAVYHVVQSIALVFLFFGFRRAAVATAFPPRRER